MKLLLPTVPAALALLLLGAAPASAQIPGGLTREQMWPAPTAEDWAKPCLIRWQRTWDDAVALSRETGQAILICVNMDGEIASEHYAGIRYRQPDIAALYEPYVCVIASTYRHNPRDYDDEGNRIPCPRFGTVTCGEHIWIEPGLFDQYFEGQRVAPRHIGVELDSTEMYDVFYAFDTDSVFQAVREGIENRPAPPPVARGDRSLLERVNSTDSADREVVERAYREGDREQRMAILRAALKSEGRASVDVLRLALRGFDVDAAQLARTALAQSHSPTAVGLIAEALRVPMPEADRELLIAALERLGEKVPYARTLAAVHRGLERSSESVDVGSWASALDVVVEREAQAVDRATLEYRLDSQARESYARTQDPEAQLALAEASLALAVDPSTAETLPSDPRAAQSYAQLMFEDARRAAQRARELGATPWRTSTVLAVAAYNLGERDEAFRLAEEAVGAMPAGSLDWNAMAALALFAEGRRARIDAAVKSKEDWPPQWLTDVHATYAVLAEHPYGLEQHVEDHYDFLLRLGAFNEASAALDAGLERFPESWGLHARLRGRSLGQGGIEGLEAEYERRLREAGDEPAANLEWFAGYASLVTAEFHRRAGDPEAARAAYDRAVGHYEANAARNPASRESGEHYVALAIAGTARVALEQGRLEEALEGVLASFARDPEAASSLDGLGISPVGTAQMLLTRLREAELADAAARLEAALAQLDPRHLELPAFEQLGPETRQRLGGRRLRRASDAR